MKIAKRVRLPIAFFASLVIGAGLAACSNQQPALKPSPPAPPSLAANTPAPTSLPVAAPAAAATSATAAAASSAPAGVGAAGQPTAAPAAPPDPARVLWGGWNAVATCLFNGSRETVLIAFSPNHSYTQTTMCSGINGPSTYRILITGNYEVLATGRIHFTDMKSDPEKLPNGHPYLSGTSETDEYQLTDNNNTLTLSNAVCPACTITYHRS